MPNWCSNFVSVSGNKKSTTNFIEEIASLKKESDLKEEGVRPFDEGEYMFDIYISDKRFFSFESRWSPVINSLKFLALKHSVNVSNEYHEPNMCIYGKWEYDSKSNSEFDICLEQEEYDLFSYDEETSIYHFEGEDYETDEEILEILLSRKSIN